MVSYRVTRDRAARPRDARSGATERPDQLGARRGELESRLHDLRGRVRLSDLRIPQLDHAAGAVLVSPLRELEALAGRDQRILRGDLRRFRRTDGEERL